MQPAAEIHHSKSSRCGIMKPFLLLCLTLLFRIEGQKIGLSEWRFPFLCIIQGKLPSDSCPVHITRRAMKTKCKIKNVKNKERKNLLSNGPKYREYKTHSIWWVNKTGKVIICQCINLYLCCIFLVRCL